MKPHIVKCYYCGKSFDTEKVPYIKVNSRRYAHKNCTQDDMEPEERDIEIFYNMIKSIYGPKYNYQLINQQATNYIEQYGYTWSGMTACLYWFYKINNGSIEEGNGGIGIVPYVYEQVKQYYQDIYATREKNKTKTPRGQIIKFDIQSPRVWHQPPHLLDIGE